MWISDAEPILGEADRPVAAEPQIDERLERARGLDVGEQPTIRSVGSTGAPLPAEGFRWVYEQLPGVWLTSVSGGRVAYMDEAANQTTVHQAKPQGSAMAA